MKIKKVMFSGPKENNRPEDLIDFVKTDEKIEFGLYFTQNNTKGNARYDWSKAFASMLSENDSQSTLQIGYEWCEDFCKGLIAPEIMEMLNYTNKSGKNTFHAIQLNFYLNQHNISQEKLIEIIKQYPQRRFILSYNTVNKDFIDSLTYKGTPFDILYKPYTEMESVKNSKDFFQGRMQGYSGDFTVENIDYWLDKIATTTNPQTGMYIDIYKALLEEDGSFSLAAAKDFMKNINDWIYAQSLKRSIL